MHAVPHHTGRWNAAHDCCPATARFQPLERPVADARARGDASTMTDPHRHSSNEYDVIVAGAGPTGLVLAIDLGRRGVRTLLLERDPTTKAWPKMDRSNARTMEIFRRLGF